MVLVEILPASITTPDSDNNSLSPAVIASKLTHQHLLAENVSVILEDLNEANDVLPGHRDQQALYIGKKVRTLR